MTTAHVSAALLDGLPPSQEELLEGIALVIRRHPLLSAVVRGKGKYFVEEAAAYPLHSDYLGKAVEYTTELLRTYPDVDIQRFEASKLGPEELALRALRVVAVPVGSEDTSAQMALQAAWRTGFEQELDGLTLDEDGDGPLWRLTLYTAEGNDSSSALVYAANHAISDQLSFNLILSELLGVCSELRSAARSSGISSPLNAAPKPLPLPPSVEGALLGAEQRQDEEIKERLELLVGRFGDPVGPEVGGRRWLPTWESGRARLSSLRYTLWQLGAGSGMKVLPRWVPSADTLLEMGSAAEDWGARARRTRSIFRTLDPQRTAALVAACRAEGVTASGALCAVALLGVSDAMGDDEEEEKAGGGDPSLSVGAVGGLKELLDRVCSRVAQVVEGAAGSFKKEVKPEEKRPTQRYKLLQALDMRTLNFGQGEAKTLGARDDWSKGTVVAGTGSLDILVDLPCAAGAALRGGERTPEELASFWRTAKECNRQTKQWINAGWGRESLLLFSSGWEFMNMNRVVELGAQDRATLGRAYSAGISNVGVFAHNTTFGESPSGGDPALSLSQLYFGISQTVSAPAISISAVTIEGTLCLTVQYASPIWPKNEAEAFADSIIRMLEIASADAFEEPMAPRAESGEDLDLNLR